MKKQSLKDSHELKQQIMTPSAPYSAPSLATELDREEMVTDSTNANQSTFPSKCADFPPF
jgi:hypothetical protein